MKRSARAARSGEEENGFDRLDRRIGQLWSRFWACVLALVGLGFAVITLGNDDFALSTHWPGLLVAGALAFLARYFWTAKEGMLSMLSDVGQKQ